MIIPDSNLLIYSYDSTARHHVAARKWWEKTLSGPEAVGIPLVVILAFVRLMTHSVLCENPMTTTQAQSSIESWFAVDGVRLLSPTYGTITRMFDLLEKAGLGGNLTTDALIAAHALESGGRVFTNDMDFARFPEVICENPLSAS